MLREAVQYHAKRDIPARFSVLAGEIIHHLRSCLDHIIWQLSRPDYRERNRWYIEFPILVDKPVDKDAIARYERKIKGITKPSAIRLIESLQPYNTPDPTDTLLYIVHDFDRVDKHRELVICVPSGAVILPPEMTAFAKAYRSAHPELTPGQFARKLKGYGKLVPQVSFKDFGRRKVQPVAPGLVELNNYIVWIISQFADL